MEVYGFDIGNSKQKHVKKKVYFMLCFNDHEYAHPNIFAGQNTRYCIEMQHARSIKNSKQHPSPQVPSILLKLYLIYMSSPCPHIKWLWEAFKKTNC